MSFGIYLVGYIISIVGLAIGAHLLNAPGEWIGVGVLCLVGAAIVHSVKSTRQKDAPPKEALPTSSSPASSRGTRGAS